MLTHRHYQSLLNVKSGHTLCELKCVAAYLDSRLKGQQCAVPQVALQGQRHEASQQARGVGIK